MDHVEKSLGSVLRLALLINFICKPNWTCKRDLFQFRGKTQVRAMCVLLFDLAKLSTRRRGGWDGAEPNVEFVLLT